MYYNQNIITLFVPAESIPQQDIKEIGLFDDLISEDRKGNP